MQTLHQILSSAFYKDYVPEFIYSNLNTRFDIRYYQKEAFGRFIYYWDEYRVDQRKSPVHLLYHMATGSGKTLIMAGLIIYLYSKGYRNFIFFVNSSNIIDKTRDNFLNAASSKYLFAENIFIGSRQIQMKEVNNFQAAGEDDINIVFSTIQGLHSRLNTPRENNITYEDFDDEKIVLISDEAHHINADTKKGKELASEEIISWEGTVNRILNANKENVLLEFTATADLSIPEVARKYSNKLIYDYSLKQFRIDRFSKEVKVLQADLPSFQRALQAILLSQYRRKLFAKYGMNIKPVILFKSRTIKESQFFFSQFRTAIKKLTASDLEKIQRNNYDNILKRVFHYFQLNGITLPDLVDELKEDFSEGKLISVNSKEESEEKQLAVNMLEDEDNEFRAVFAVDKLNEGWDVLNLFDIVRLYDTKGGNSDKTTMSEAQLIGRGARYCPFQIREQSLLFSRKFDDDLSNELRICEELYYHSSYNPEYIRALSSALEEIGIKANEKEKQTGSNKRQPDIRSDRNSFAYFFKSRQKNVFKIDLKTGQSRSAELFNPVCGEEKEKWQKEYKLAELGDIVIRKAMNRLPQYQFSILKKMLPDLKSVSEFITSPGYLGGVRIKISGLPEQVNHLSAQDKLEASIKVLKEIAAILPSSGT